MNGVLDHRPDLPRLIVRMTSPDFIPPPAPRFEPPKIYPPPYSDHSDQPKPAYIRGCGNPEPTPDANHPALVSSIRLYENAWDS